MIKKAVKRIWLVTLAVCWMNPLTGSTASLVEEGYGTFFAGELKSVGLHASGSMSPGLAMEGLGKLSSAAVIWALQEDGQGRVFVATANDGALFRYDPEQEEEGFVEIFRPRRPLLRALAVQADGTAFVGVSPEGTIYRIPADGGFAEVYARLESNYIWALEQAADGSLWVAAGQPGRVYRLPPDFGPDQEIEMVFDPKSAHVTALRLREDGGFFLGTGPDGHLMEVSAEREDRTVADFRQGEIRHIFPQQDGSLYLTIFKEGGGQDNDNLPSGLYRFDAEGFVQLLWRQQGEAVFSAMETEHGLLIGSSAGGKLYAFHNRFDWEILGQAPDGGEVSAFAPAAAGGFYLATSNPAAVLRVGGDSDAKAVFTSKVLSPGQRVRWGRLHLAGEQTENIKVEVRTGNREGVNNRWTGWQTVTDTPPDVPVSSHLQYRLTLEGEDSSVRRVEIFYGLPNQAPVLGRIHALPVKVEPLPQQVQPARANFNQFLGASKAEDLEQKRNDPPMLYSTESGWMTFFWQATDPNGDSLRFQLAVRRLGEENWRSLARDLRDPYFSWQTSGVEPGFYHVRVQADDGLTRMPDSALSVTAVSDLILIDALAPAIKEISRDASTVVLRVKDSHSRIASATVRYDGGEPIILLPDDGIFDNPVEEFTLRPPSSTQGSVSVLFEAADERGNRATWMGAFGD